MTIKELYEWAVSHGMEDYPLAKSETHQEGFAGFKTDYFLLEDVGCVVNAYRNGNSVKCVLLNEHLPEMSKPKYKQR